ncbi:unnamed protein product [Clonostachys rhizophaga]|uniref:Uncharacterized protein n=1 Tax=Clonostachys rhizophaga TaxID=160324 RepID=A0A9N9V848_9HYPO|nr:unnamed protein product [Clonostachys rhizophaga]
MLDACFMCRVNGWELYLDTVVAYVAGIGDEEEDLDAGESSLQLGWRRLGDLVGLHLRMLEKMVVRAAAKAPCCGEYADCLHGARYSRFALFLSKYEDMEL